MDETPEEPEKAIARKAVTAGLMREGPAGIRLLQEVGDASKDKRRLLHASQTPASQDGKVLLVTTSQFTMQHH